MAAERTTRLNIAVEIRSSPEKWTQGVSWWPPALSYWCEFQRNFISRMPSPGKSVLDNGASPLARPDLYGYIGGVISLWWPLFHKVEIYLHIVQSRVKKGRLVGHIYFPREKCMNTFCYVVLAISILNELHPVYHVCICVCEWERICMSMCV